MRIWGLRGLILFFRQASAGPFSLASHGFKTVVIFKKMIPPCVSVFLMDVRARWSLYWWLRSRGQVAHMTKVLLSSIMLRRIPLFNWKSVTIPVFKKWKQKRWIRNHNSPLSWRAEFLCSDPRSYELDCLVMNPSLTMCSSTKARPSTVSVWLLFELFLKNAK